MDLEINTERTIKLAIEIKAFLDSRLPQQTREATGVRMVALACLVGEIVGSNANDEKMLAEGIDLMRDAVASAAHANFQARHHPEEPS